MFQFESSMFCVDAGACNNGSTPASNVMAVTDFQKNFKINNKTFIANTL